MHSKPEIIESSFVVQLHGEFAHELGAIYCRGGNATFNLTLDDVKLHDDDCKLHFKVTVADNSGAVHIYESTSVQNKFSPFVDIVN